MTWVNNYWTILCELRYKPTLLGKNEKSLKEFLKKKAYELEENLNLQMNLVFGILSGQITNKVFSNWLSLESDEVFKQIELPYFVNDTKPDEFIRSDKSIIAVENKIYDSTNLRQFANYLYLIEREYKKSKDIKSLNLIYIVPALNAEMSIVADQKKEYEGLQVLDDIKNISIDKLLSCYHKKNGEIKNKRVHDYIASNKESILDVQKKLNIKAISWNDFKECLQGVCQQLENDQTAHNLLNGFVKEIEKREELEVFSEEKAI